jgi:DNA-binding transcriptional LysR family regulator
MNLNHLAVFHAVVLEGGFSAGAERLMVSQPAVSKQLKELERSIGSRLIDRLPRGIRLTDVGKTLAEHASRIFAAVGAAERAVSEVRGVRSGRLSIGASTSIGVYLLPQIFVRYRQLYPSIELKLEIGNSETTAAHLEAGAIELGLMEVAPEPDRFDFAEFMRDDLVIIVPPGHAFARRRAISAKELCGEPFVVRETGSETKSLVERALASAGHAVKPVMSLGSTEAIKRAVTAGLGVSVISGYAVGLEERAGTLGVVCLSDLSISRPLYRVQAKNHEASYAVEAFNHLLDETVSGRKKVSPRKRAR